MKKLDRMLDVGMRFLMAISMLSLVAGGFWQIFSRWILGNPSTFTEEFMRYMLIWAGMIGSAYCFYKDQHLTLDLISSKAKGTSKVVLTAFIEIMILAFICYVFIFGGFKLAINSTNASPVLHIPFKVLYSVLPISGCFIVLARILKYMQMVVDKKNNNEKEGAGE